jgi:hypothetical protein
VARQERLRERLRAFELSAGAARGPKPQPGRLECVDDAGYERNLRPHDRQRDALLAREVDQRREIGDS